VSHFPLRFAVVLPCEDGRHVRWTLHQGADPCLHEGVARARVEKDVRPRVVVRLNRLTVPAILKSRRVAVHYGAHCERVLYVHDLQADVLCAYGHRAHSPAELRAVATLLAALFADLVAEMRHYKPRKAKRGALAEATVFVHCHGGLERSRFVLLALHALFFVAATLAHAPATRACAALLEWTQRQAHLQAHGLSVAQLLTDANPLLFKALAHCLALVAGADQDAVYDGLVASEREPTRLLFATCHAGPHCIHWRAPQRPAWLCLRCHDAVFCSLDCIAACPHGTGTCTRLYSATSAPTTL
jgi:hypothetical protein